MSKAKVKRTDSGHGADFINLQRTTDEAKNERLKSERDEDKLDPSQANRPENKNETTDTVSQKKTGGGSSKSLGD
jgi:hypothetical protein